MDDPGLLQQPLPRRHDVRHPFATGAHLPLLDPALRAEFARAVTVRQQDGLAVLQQLLGPVAVARQDRLGTAGQSAAAMQRDHGRKRAVAVGLVKLLHAILRCRRGSRPVAAPATAAARGQSAKACSRNRGNERQECDCSDRAHLGLRLSCRIGETAIRPRKKLACGENPKTSQIGGVHRRTARPIHARWVDHSGLPEVNYPATYRSVQRC